MQLTIAQISTRHSMETHAQNHSRDLLPGSSRNKPASLPHCAELIRNPCVAGNCSIRCDLDLGCDAEVGGDHHGDLIQ